MRGKEFDQVLCDVGEFGFYQKRLLLLMTVTFASVILQNLSPVFTMKITPHRCKIPGLDNDTYHIQNSFHASLVNRTIPVDDTGDYSSCSMYDVSDGYDVTAENRTEVECDDWVFDQSVFTSTYVTELKLVCGNKQYRSISTMMIFIGKFVGAFCNSVGGDYFGRRRLYLVMMLAMSATGVALVFVSSLPSLMVLRFFAGATTTGCYLPTYVIAMELVGTSYRRVVGMVSKTSGTVASLAGALLAFLVRDWRYFQVCLAAPCAVTMVGYFVFPESPRWLASKGRYAEAQKVIDQMAKANGVTVSPKLRSDTFNGLDNSEEKTSTEARVTPFQLFRHPRLMLRYFLLYSSWILLIMCLYGLNLNVSNMKGDIFLNSAIMETVDVISLLLFIFLIERVGRRAFILTTAAVGGVACLSTILPTVLGGNDWILRGLSFGGKMGVSSALSGIYVMSPELYPTVLRSFGLGSCSMVSRLGGIASPYVADLNILVGGVWGPALPQIVFGVAGITTACMLFFIPETRGRNLPETVRDAVLFGRSENDATRRSQEMAATTLLVKEEEECPSPQRKQRQE